MDFTFSKRSKYELVSEHNSSSTVLDNPPSNSLPDLSEVAQYKVSVAQEYAVLLKRVEANNLDRKRQREEGVKKEEEENAVVAPSSSSDRVTSSAAETKHEPNVHFQRREGIHAASPFLPDLAALNRRYKRLLKIGEGSFGEVFIVYDSKAKVYMTMKRIYRLLHRPGKALIGIHSTTLRELDLLSSIHHPNIVSLIDYHILSDGTLLIFLPLLRHDFASLLRSWTFGTRMKPPNIPISVVKCLFRQIIEGMWFLHSKKIIHRDLKPSNVMVDEHGIVRIIDFGWARFITDERHGRMTGPPCTVSYRAPEVLLGGSRHQLYDFAIDIWDCGCVLFEMLTGKPFVRGPSEREALDSIVDWLGSPPEGNTLYYGKEIHRFFHLKANAKPDRFIERCEALSVRREDAAFLQKFLHWDPKKRISLAKAKVDEWFARSPPACAPSEIALPEKNMFRWLERNAKH